MVLVAGSLNQYPAHAQETPSHSTLQADTVLVSEYREADSLVRRYRVQTTGEGEITLHYRINLAKMDRNYMANSEELTRLDDFMQQLSSDSLYQLKRVAVKGVASPDGPQALNERLAKGRMKDAVAYLNKHYAALLTVPIEESWQIVPWQEVVPWLEKSSLSNREEAIGAIADTRSASEKEQDLKRLPEIWNYLRHQVLPSLRYADVMLSCERTELFEVRSYVAPPKPTPAPTPKPTAQRPPCNDPCGECAVVDEGITGLIIETGY